MDNTANDFELNKNGLNDNIDITLPTIVYNDEFINDIQCISISPRDELSFVDDKKEYKKHQKFLNGNKQLYCFSRILQTEIISRKPENILDFINDEFFSSENQQKLRLMFKS